MGADPIWGLGWKVLERAGGCEWNVSRPVQADVVRGGGCVWNVPRPAQADVVAGEGSRAGVPAQVQLARSPVVL